MKYYSGYEKGDKVSGYGGKYVKENMDGGEAFNFQDYNGHCYGFVNLYGNINLERLDNSKKYDSELNGALVIWTAKQEKEDKHVIVGWYRNATIYREMQYNSSFPNVGRDIDYSFKARSEDCVLLPDSERSYEIPRASVVGTGKGMGRSNIWYADSDYGKAEIIPEIIQYVENYGGKRINTIYSDDILNASKNDEEIRLGGIEKVDDVDSIYNRALDLNEIGEYYEALMYFNAAYNKELEKSGVLPDEILCDYYVNKAMTLQGLNCFDRSIEYREKVVSIEGETLDTLGPLLYLYEVTNSNDKAIQTCLKLLDLTDPEDAEIVCEILGALSDTYSRMNMYQEAVDVLDRILSITKNEDLIKHTKLNKEGLLNLV
jgi:hypothetical protein